MRISTLLPSLVTAILLIVGGAASSHAQSGSALSLVLPTPNKNILKGGEGYYMYVDRTFDGRSYKPWQGGQYGFVRSPTYIRGTKTKIYKRFHEGIDIRPTKRDAKGYPTDPIFSVDKGRVRHVNNTSGASNYGKYIVIEHTWDGSPFFTLYAHLRETYVKPGDKVTKGQRIALMGWTGNGINLERAHLHFEINMMMHKDFEQWHSLYFKGSPNHHGIYNGLNMFGLDVADLYKTLAAKPSTTISGYLKSQPWYFKVRIPNTGNLQLVKRYPWLKKEGDPRPKSWEISFTDTAIPIAAEPSSVPCSSPKLSNIKNSSVPYYYITRTLVTGSQGSAKLSNTGLRTMHLMSFPK